MKYNLKTGYALIRDESGKVRSKLNLPPGERELVFPFEFTLENIESEELLNSIVVEKPKPKDVVAKQAVNDARAKRLAKLAQSVDELNMGEATTVAVLRAKVIVLADAVAELLKGAQ